MSRETGCSRIPAKIPVRDYVLARLPTTLMISGSAFLLSILVAVPIGVLSAIKQYSLFDQAATTFAFLGFSIRRSSPASS